MRYKKNRTVVYKAITLVEIVIAMAMMAIISAVVFPQFGIIQNNWDSKQARDETIQSGRALIDHINRNLLKAVRIVDVSGPSVVKGYVEFEDNDGNTLRYDVAANNYVEFGIAGSLSDLAGPISQLQFACYDACDLDTQITDVNSIRLVNVSATMVNSASSEYNKAFSTSVYLRTNGNSVSEQDFGNVTYLGFIKAREGLDVKSITISTCTPDTFESKVSDGDDDAEEDEDGDMSLDDKSIKLGEQEYVGLRFLDVEIPQGANISNAYISFRAAESDTKDTDILIFAEDSDDTERFDNDDDNISSRVTTSASVTWNNISNWSKNSNYETPDISAVIEEVVNRDGWSNGNSISVILKSTDLDGERVFYSRDKNYSNAPFIHIEYEEQGDMQFNTGDLLIAAVATDGEETISPPAGQGWNLIDHGSYSNRVTLGVWWKLAAVSEPSSYEFTWGSNEQCYGWIMSFTGHDADNPISSSSSATDQSFSPLSPAVTTTVENSMILRIGCFDDDDIAIDNPGLSGHTAITMDASNSGNGTVSGGAGYVEQAETGYSGTSNFSLGGNEESRTVTIAIAPAGTEVGGGQIYP